MSLGETGVEDFPEKKRQVWGEILSRNITNLTSVCVFFFFFLGGGEEFYSNFPQPRSRYCEGNSLVAGPLP